jgi:hypothetical protein
LAMGIWLGAKHPIEPDHGSDMGRNKI